MTNPSCCCCFSSNVRHLVLLLTTLCITALFANVVLFGLTTVLHDEGDLSAGLRTVPSLENLHGQLYDKIRYRRSIDNSSEVVKSGIDSGKAINDTLTQIIEKKNDDEGHPIITHQIPEEFTTTFETVQTPPPKNTRFVMFTNSPTPLPTTRVTRDTPALPTSTNPSNDLFDLSVNEEKLHVSEDTDKVQKEPKRSKVYSESLFSYLLRASVYAAPGLGVLIGTFPATKLVNMWSSRNVFTFALLLSGLLTLLTPPLVLYGFVPIFLIRFLIGVCFSVALPVAGCVTANWGTLKEQLTFIALIFLFVPWAPIFSWNLSMFFYSNDVSVKYIYIAHAVVSVLCAISFFIFHRDKPQYHNWVNGIELNKIVAGKVQELKNNRILSNPFGTLIRSISAWAIWVAMFGFFTVVTVFHSFLPTFFSNMDVWMVDYIGLYGSLPFLGMPLFYLLSGIANRSICCKSTTQVRIWNSISFSLTTLFIIAFPVLFLSGDEGASRNLLLTLTLSPLGLVVAGALRSATLVGRFYAQYILSYMGFSLGAAMTLVPCIVLSIVKTNDLAEWLRVFLLSAVILALSGVGFAVFGRGRSAGWAEHSWNPAQVSKMRTLDPIDITNDECGIYEMRLISNAQN